MLSTNQVEVLKALRRHTAVQTPAGHGVVLCQLRNLVTVLEGAVVRVYERHEIEERR